MVNEKCLEKYGKKLENCENHEIYTALLEAGSVKRHRQGQQRRQEEDILYFG